MQAMLDHFIEQSLTYTLIAVVLVAFLESLVLVGLLLPGALMMAGLGGLIGAGQLSLYQAWIAALAGCLLADWLSFYIGWQFKNALHRNRLVNNYRSWLDKIEYALHNHNMTAIIAGRFVGPTRPLVPMVAGMLDLSPVKFAIPSLIGSLLWPPVYFMPGILAGAAIDIPPDANSGLFKLMLCLLALLIWLALWLCWRTWRLAKGKISQSRFSYHHWRLCSLLICAVTMTAFVAIQYHPLMAIYRHLLWQIMAL